jgi:hypothetical protein
MSCSLIGVRVNRQQDFRDQHFLVPVAAITVPGSFAGSCGIPIACRRWSCKMATLYPEFQAFWKLLTATLIV